jgi:hypothetical protein
MIQIDTKCYQYRCFLKIHVIMQHFSDCDGSAIFGILDQSRNLDQFLSTSDAI